MNNQLDSLARSFVSRRSSLAGISAVDLGLLSPQEVSAHNPLAACKRIKGLKRRRARFEACAEAQLAAPPGAPDTASAETGRLLRRPHNDNLPREYRLPVRRRHSPSLMGDN